MQAALDSGRFPVQLKGNVVRVMFNNADSGWSVIVVHPEDGSEIKQKEVTVTGVIHEVRAHDNVEIFGEWTYNTKYREQQIKAEEIRVLMPETEDGIYYLLKAKGFLPGIGEKIAKAIVDRFGIKTFAIIEQHPDQLAQIDGISRKKAAKIGEAYAEKVKMRDILEFCAIYGIPQGQGKKIFEVYGASAVTILKRNPYLLTESNKGVRGIGFKKADAIAKSLSLPPQSEARISHGLVYSLRELTASIGGTSVARSDLLDSAKDLLQLDVSLVESVLNNMLEEKGRKAVLVRDELNGYEAIWDKKVYEREKYIANKIISIDECPKHNYIVPDDIDVAIADAEARSGITLAPSQKMAIKNSLEHPFSVITGGPGVGKTTIIRCLIDILLKFKNDIALAAPTGRASKRMSEATGMKATTIHRLLGVGRMETGGEDEENKKKVGFFNHDESTPLENEVYIIDEASMIDNSLMCSLLQAIPEGSMVVFVGDVDQLPSVGAGKVLEDVIMSGVVTVSRLDTIFRQAASSKIITSAHAINNGKMPDMESDPNSDFFVIKAEDNDSCARMILKLVDYIPRKFNCDRLWDIQVLSPKKTSEVGVEALNRMLQEYYLPEVQWARIQLFAKDKQKRREMLSIEETQSLSMVFQTPMAISSTGNIFAVGDKVMQTKNDYNKKVFNGDVGQIVGINTQIERGKDAEDFAIVAFPDDSGNGWRRVNYSKKDLWTDITLSYACTIHKSQGSEYPYVIIPMMPTFSIMLQRKLLYTGVTRGKKMVCLVGAEESISYAVHDHFEKRVSRRLTKLKYWLGYRKRKGSNMMVEKHSIVSAD